MGPVGRSIHRLNAHTHRANHNEGSRADVNQATAADERSPVNRLQPPLSTAVVASFQSHSFPPLYLNPHATPTLTHRGVYSDCRLRTIDRPRLSNPNSSGTRYQVVVSGGGWKERAEAAIEQRCRVCCFRSCPPSLLCALFWLAGFTPGGAIGGPLSIGGGAPG